MVKQLIAAVVITVFAPLAVAEPYELDAQGIVQGVDLAARTVTISGYRYEVAPSARIRVAGNAASVGALEDGMKVRYVYKVYEGLDARVAATEEGSVLVEVVQLADSTIIDEF